MFGGAPVRAAEQGERTLAQERFVDESQENGGYGDLRMTAPRLVIDADQENGSSDTELRMAPLMLVIDESQERASASSSRVSRHSATAPGCASRGCSPWKAWPDWPSVDPSQYRFSP